MIERARTVVRSHGRSAFLFGCIGVLNLATDFAVYAVGLMLGLHPAIANVISFVFANVQSYRLNSLVTFRRDGRAAPLSTRGYLKFAGAHILGLGIATVCIVILAPIIGPIAAKAVAVVLAAVSNYTLSALFVFDAKSSPARS